MLLRLVKSKLDSTVRSQTRSIKQAHANEQKWFLPSIFKSRYNPKRKGGATMSTSWNKMFLHTGNGYLFAISGIATVTAALAPFHERFSSTTVALALLLVVLFAATGWGSRPAALAAILGGVCFNFFFLPPLHTFVIAAPQNWTALAAFLITAVTAGQLSARAKRRAEEAEAGRREIERLYQEYQIAAEQAKQAEVFRRSERLKSALLDAVTHDLRTPLTSIKASVTTLLAEESSDEPVVLDPEGRSELLEVINEETDRLNRFVEHMVELAQLEAGELHLRRRWGAVEEIVALARDRASELTAKHPISVSIERELPAARVDANLLAEVLYSLIDNAAKYSPANSPIRLTANRDEDGMILIAVEDQGRGIPSGMRERVFDKFFRVTNDGAYSPSGLGMGLAIARGNLDRKRRAGPRLTGEAADSNW
jgi:K+-sensing histidine kinase KdpD